MGKKNKNKGFKIGSSFSARDLASARDMGYSDNKILKLAAKAPRVKNSANKVLGQLNSAYTNPTNGLTGSAGLLSSALNFKRRDKAGNKDPKKVLTWNGLNANGSANGLTINKRDTGRGKLFGGYTSGQDQGNGMGSYGQWTSYSSGGGGGGKDKSKSTDSAGGGDGLGIGSAAGSANTSAYGTPEPYSQAGSSVAGFDESISDSVTSFRRKKSNAKSTGLTSKGTSQFKIGGQSTASSGLNIGSLNR